MIAIKLLPFTIFAAIIAVIFGNTLFLIVSIIAVLSLVIYIHFIYLNVSPQAQETLDKLVNFHDSVRDKKGKVLKKDQEKIYALYEAEEEKIYQNIPPQLLSSNDYKDIAKYQRYNRLETEKIDHRLSSQFNISQAQLEDILDTKYAEESDHFSKREEKAVNEVSSNLRELEERNKFKRFFVGSRNKALLAQFCELKAKIQAAKNNHMSLWELDKAMRKSFFRVILKD